jgi:hypothetical protein
MSIEFMIGVIMFSSVIDVVLSVFIFGSVCVMNESVKKGGYNNDRFSRN